MAVLCFGFNFPPPVERPSSETNQAKEQERGPEADQAPPSDLVSQDKEQGRTTDAIAQSVLFAGWASFVLGSPGHATMHGIFSPAEQLVVDTLNSLSASSGTTKLFGWEALQGLLTSSGNVIGIEGSLATKTFYSGARDVAAGGPSCDHYTVVVDDLGHLLYWTASEPTPKSLSSSSPGVTFERAWAGEGHFLALATNGTLYSWGSGRHGQLGHGNLKSETRPKCIESLEGIRIVDAACGGSFSIALSEIGDVYTFGLNDHGQLGIGHGHVSSESDEHHPGRNNAYPQLVDFYGKDDEHETPLDVSVVKVACGQAHALCLDDQGNAWSCGWGKYGQLEPQDTSHKTTLTSATLTKSNDRYTFQRIATTEGNVDHWRNIKCGRWSSFLWE